MAAIEVLFFYIQERYCFFSAFSEALRIGRPKIVDSSLHLLLQVPNYIPEEDKFDFIVLVGIPSFLCNLVSN